MLPLPTTENYSHQGIRVTLYKSLKPGHENSGQTRFLVWGASDYLYIDLFNSLSEISLLRENDIENEDAARFPLIEKRHLYLYKDQDTHLNQKEDIDWIFSDLLGNPLLVITLLKSAINEVQDAIKKLPSKSKFHFDIFKTLGQSTGVIVFRSSSYEDIMNCIINLNLLSDNTYSIAAIQQVDSKSKRKQVHHKVTEILHVDSDQAISYVTINLLLKDGQDFKNRVENSVKNLLDLRKELIRELELNEEEFKLRIYFVLGRFDVEVNLEGQTNYLLRFLLDRKYGLVNMQSKFYAQHVRETQTTWKTLHR